LKSGKEVKVIYEEREVEYDEKYKVWKGVEGSSGRREFFDNYMNNPYKKKSNNNKNLNWPSS